MPRCADRTVRWKIPSSGRYGGTFCNAARPSFAPFRHHVRLVLLAGTTLPLCLTLLISLAWLLLLLLRLIHHHHHRQAPTTLLARCFKCRTAPHTFFRRAHGVQTSATPPRNLTRSARLDLAKVVTVALSMLASRSAGLSCCGPTPSLPPLNPPPAPPSGPWRLLPTVRISRSTKTHTAVRAGLSLQHG